MINHEARQVSWRQVHRFVQPVLNQVHDWPMVGTAPWCNLSNEDPRKWCSLLDGAQHWALRVEGCQEALAAASRAIAAAVPLVDDDLLSVKTKPVTTWKAVAQEIQRRNGFYATRPWLRRAVDR
jgi:hypothetical protein